jgi:hypothetical protein
MAFPILPLLAVAGLGIAALVFSKGKEPGGANTLRFVVYEADNGTWTYAIYQADKLVYSNPDAEVFADQAAAETAAAIWISQNPNAQPPAQS